MLGTDPYWDQMQNSKNAHLHANIQCWALVVLLNCLISLHIILVFPTKDKTFLNEIYLRMITLLMGKR